MTERNQYDPQTGLPERGYLWSLLDDSLSRIRRSGTPAGLLLIQLEDLNSYQQLIGAEGIEEYTKLMAGRLKNCLWDLDDAVRFDERQFVYFAGGINRLEDIHVVMKKVVDYLSVPCEIKEYTLTPSIRIGVVVLPEDGETADEIMANAQIALGHARSGVYGYFNQQLGETIARQEQIKSSILSTLAEESFVLMLQPKISTESREVCGIEALVRIRDSEGNIVTPAEFIPVAENSNLILEIGEWVLSKAQEVSNDLKAAGLNIPVSVNISEVQFRNSASLLSTLHKLAATEDAAPGNIILEISENTITNNVALSAALMAEIKSCGYQISIDGFGTGFSSLSVLKDLSVDEIKVDRHFLSDVPSDEKNTAILKSIIMLGKAMNFRVVVMGVETEAQFNTLKEHECDEFQGFLVSEPIDAGSFVSWHKDYTA